MTDINYSSTDLNQMDQLREYINDYCAANNIDPATYVAALDDGANVDLSDDPAFQAYWQLAYLQLVYLLSGGATDMSSPGDVVYDEDQLMAAYNAVANDPEQNYILELAEEMLMDDPELMAFFTTQTAGADAGNTLLATINLSGSSSTSSSASDSSSDESSSTQYTYVDEQARAFAEAYGSGSGLDWIIEYEEGVRGAEGSILNQLAEMDQQLVELTDALNSGSMTAEEYSAQVDQLSAYRETMLAMLQQLEANLSNIMEMYSKLIEQANEMAMSVINNMRPV
jgi:hypothetical protein